MKRNISIPFILAALVTTFVAFGLSSCKSKQKGDSQWMKEYDVAVAIDESFQPIMDNLVQTFGLAHREATMKPYYVSEDSAIRMLVNDSVRCAIITRKLTDREQIIIKGHNLGATQSLIATDAIALVVNKQSPDSLITLDEVKGIVSGKITRWEQLKNHHRKGTLRLIFDNSGSSTVRYMRDSLNNGANLQGNVFASDGGTNQSVLETVKKDPEVIGVVGANWLMGNSSTALSDFNQLDVKVMAVLGPNSFGYYVRPYQFKIATGEYPLHRSVYIIHTDPRTQSLLRQFFFFVKGQKGQTIICNNSQLLPASQVEIKAVDIN